MAGDDEYDQDNTLPGGSYSQLLFADDDDVVGLDKVGCFSFSSDQHFSPESPSEMLRFGDYSKECGDDHRYHRMVLVENTSRPAQDCGVTCSDSLSPVSSTANSNHNKDNTLSKYNKKRNGSGKDSSMFQTSITGGAGAGGGNQKNSKKVKTENSTVTGHAKVKKEKLGARISALQQLVSPFGKTDTASVLHEAMSYIRFLHDQVQVLCCPYLQRLSSSGHLLQEVKENGQEEPHKELLRSGGLCLVPVELTSHVADTNGADFWSPAVVNNNVSSNQ